MREYLLFVDTETSGIPESLSKSITEVRSWPFVLQVAWRIYTREGALVKSENHFVYEEEIYIEKSSFKVHGITKDDLREKGRDRRAVMKLFSKDLRRYQPLVVGHFVEFDSKMLQVAMFRSGVKNILRNYPHFCTMRSTGDYTRFPNHDYPKLEDLYMGLFGEKMVRLHDAAVDVEATARCFFELYRKGEIDEQLITNQPLFVKVKEKVSQKTGCGLPALFFMISGGLLYLLL